MDNKANVLYWYCRWKKRWFVLEGGTLSYYDRPQDATGSHGKHFSLRPDSSTSYTSTDNCFCVKSADDAHESSNWYLIAKDERSRFSSFFLIYFHELFFALLQ